MHLEAVRIAASDPCAQVRRPWSWRGLRWPTVVLFPTGHGAAWTAGPGSVFRPHSLQGVWQRGDEEPHKGACQTLQLPSPPASWFALQLAPRVLGMRASRIPGFRSKQKLNLWALSGGPFPPAPSGPGRGEAWDPGLTIKVVQGHDDVQVSTQDLAKLVHQGRVISRINSHMVPRLIPGGDARLRGRVEGSSVREQEAWVKALGRGVAAAGT